MADRQFQLRQNLSAAPYEVFNAWTQAEALKAWFAPGPMTTPEAEMDARVGGRYKITLEEPDGTRHTATGVFEEVVPYERLVFTWRWTRGTEDLRVTITFKPEGKATQLTIVLDGFTNEESRAKTRQGWTGCLEKLPLYLASLT